MPTIHQSEFTWWAYRIQNRKRDMSRAQNVRALITEHPMFTEAQNNLYMNELTKFTTRKKEGGYAEDGAVDFIVALGGVHSFIECYGRGIESDHRLAQRIKECAQEAQGRWGDSAIAAYCTEFILNENHPRHWDAICGVIAQAGGPHDIFSARTLREINAIRRQQTP